MRWAGAVELGAAAHGSTGSGTFAAHAAATVLDASMEPSAVLCAGDLCMPTPHRVAHIVATTFMLESVPVGDGVLAPVLALVLVVELALILVVVLVVILVVVLVGVRVPASTVLAAAAVPSARTSTAPFATGPIF